jgi:putative transcriptional regulator
MAFFKGSFLIAKPTLRDPNFHQTVVLLVQHDDEGAFGLIVNRPVPAAKEHSLPFPLYSGGPCQAEGLFMIHGQSAWAQEEAEDEAPNEIAPGIFLGDASLANKLKDLSKAKMKWVRLFAGYAGWGPGQLEQELQQGAWAVSPADAQTLFKTSPKDLWSHLRPPAIPQPSLN